MVGQGSCQRVLAQAREYLIVADTAPTPSLLAWGAAFHAQEAAETALKAFIYRLGDEPEPTHGLRKLALCAAEMNASRAVTHRSSGTSRDLRNWRSTLSGRGIQMLRPSARRKGARPSRRRGGYWRTSRPSSALDRRRTVRRLSVTA